MAPSAGHNVSGAPGELPPPPGSVDSDGEPTAGSGSKALRRIIPIIIVIVTVVIVGIVYVVSNSGDKTTSTTGPTTLVIPLPTIPTDLPKVPASQVCLQTPSLLTKGEQIRTAALQDVASANMTLPSVTSAELVSLIIRLRILTEQSPKRLAAELGTYTEFFVNLYELQSGSPAGEINSSASSRAATQIKSTCASQ